MFQTVGEDMPKEAVMQWTIGDMFVIRGVLMNGEDDTKTGE